MQRKTSVKACPCAASIFRNQEVKAGSHPSSHRCAGKVGKSGHAAWCDTVTSEGLDTTRKAGKIPRELLQSQGETWRGLEEIACLRSRFAFGTWIQPQAARKSGKVWEVLAEAEWESSGARQLLPGLGHTSILQRSGKVRWEMSDPRNWDLKSGRTKAQEV